MSNLCNLTIGDKFFLTVIFSSLGAAALALVWLARNDLCDNNAPPCRELTQASGVGSVVLAGLSIYLNKRKQEHDQNDSEACMTCEWELNVRLLAASGLIVCSWMPLILVLATEGHEGRKKDAFWTLGAGLFGTAITAAVIKHMVCGAQGVSPQDTGAGESLLIQHRT